MSLYYSTFAERISTIFTNKLNNFPNHSNIQIPEAQHRHVVMLYKIYIVHSRLHSANINITMNYPHVDPRDIHILLTHFYVV